MKNTNSQQMGRECGRKHSRQSRHTTRRSNPDGHGLVLGDSEIEYNSPPLKRKEDEEMYDFMMSL
ncbi:MAG: hypothetical protein Q8P86_02155 [bacterium]|nr:hypothetical protein [bacterium]